MSIVSDYYSSLFPMILQVWQMELTCLYSDRAVGLVTADNSDKYRLLMHCIKIKSPAKLYWMSNMFF